MPESQNPSPVLSENRITKVLTKEAIDPHAKAILKRKMTKSQRREPAQEELIEGIKQTDIGKNQTPQEPISSTHAAEVASGVTGREDQASLARIVTVEHSPATTEKILHSSVVKNTSEVKEAIMAQKDEHGTPIFWYELTQGALDYNDWSKGKPSIEYVMSGGERLNLFEYMATRPTGEVIAVEVKNYIRPGEGLTPHNVVHFSHQGSEGTLGQHGRGLSIASTAALADNLCKGIKYRSQDEYGAWEGEGLMYQEKDQREASFALNYDRKVKGNSTSETVITIEEPSNLLLQSLRRLPTSFLLANPNYPSVSLTGAEGSPKTPNLFTISAIESPDGVSTNGWRHFSGGEIDSFQLNSAEVHTQTPRVEILPNDIVINSRGETVFVDGLRVTSNSYFGSNRKVLNWSIYGFGKAGNPSFRTGRSPDSTAVAGNMDNLAGLVLSKCDNPAIFKVVLTALLKDEVYEGRVSEKILEKMDPPAKQALETAWTEVKQSLGYTDKVLVTSSESYYKIAKDDGRDVVLVKSESFANAARQLEGSESIEDLMSLKKETTSTGELIHRKRISESALIGSSADNLLAAAAASDGRITFAPDGKSITVNMTSPQPLTQMYSGQFQELGHYLRDFSSNFSLAFINGAVCKIVVDTGKTADVFEFDASPGMFMSSDDLYSIRTQKGERPSSSKEQIQIELSISRFFDQRNRRGEIDLPTAERLFEEFTLQLKQGMDTTPGSEGKVDLEKYKATISGEREALKAALDSKQAALAKISGALKATLGIRETDVTSDRPFPRMMSEYGDSSFTYQAMSEEKGTKGILGRRDHLDNSANVVRDLSTRHTIEEGLRLYTKPDIEVKTPGKPPEMLTASISAQYSESSLANTEALLGVQRNFQTDSSVAYKTTLPAGRYYLPGIPGERPVGFTHPSNIRISFERVPGKNVWVIYSGKEIPPGLNIYFTKNQTPDVTPPDRREIQGLLDRNNLSAGWRGLLRGIDQDPYLTDKEKVDTLLEAWWHSFTYKSNFTRPSEGGLTTTVNRAEGNCLDAAKGFMGLLREVGIPTRLVTGTVVKDGKSLNTSEYSHALNQVYINGEWVLVEPQHTDKTYPEGKYKHEPNSEYYDLILKLPKKEITPETLARQNNDRLLKNLRYIPQLPKILAGGAAIASIGGFALTSLLRTTSEVIPTTNASGLTDVASRGTEVVSNAPQIVETASYLQMLSNHAPEAVLLLAILGGATSLITSRIALRRGRQEGRRQGLEKGFSLGKDEGIKQGEENIKQDLRQNLEHMQEELKKLQ